jgi:hypothetical protein
MPWPLADHPPEDDMPPEDAWEHDPEHCAFCRPDAPMTKPAMQRLAEALARFDALTTREQLWRQGAARD